ncbi:MAG: tRNA (N6-isopentenyl adenosine(37)-C2)-methylthiotransferase MiaB [Eubacteriales bacterium]|nr:tRNA (N6-isopentenyl adenosine(37)-C2)-methylthiotransferase MiaB [Eubacteriales bacterium]
MSDTIINIPKEQIDEQRQFAHTVAAIKNRPKTYHIVTYGCQMNEHDSQKISGMMNMMGMQPAKTREEADIVLFNTCCIRDNANRRALGNIIWLKEIKKERPEMLIGVCGCMMQSQGMADNILESYPFVDFAFGTGNLYKLPEILYNCISTGERCFMVSKEDSTLAEGLPVLRESKTKAYISIMQGCNNFCTYCIVPYVRGRERSRKSSDILLEAEALLKDGAKEIMLLGQNVNSYGIGSGDISFPELLRKLDELGVPRLRFMTSHPKDLSEALIEEYARSKSLCPHLHLPVQSGSDRVLKLMNRRYNIESYKQKVELLRKAVPNIGITTDIIAAFPTETEEDFNLTLSLVKEVRFDAAFTFIYSPREGTKAATMQGMIDKETASARLEKLISLQENITKEILASQVGTVHEVLVEGLSRRSDNMLTGKTGRNISVNFNFKNAKAGDIVPVEITAYGSNTLRGKEKI